MTLSIQKCHIYSSILLSLSWGLRKNIKLSLNNSHSFHSMLWSVKLSLYKALPLEYLEVFAYQNTLTQGYQNLGSLENRSHVIQQCSVVISEYFFQESADLPQGIRIFGCVSSVFTKEVVSLHLKFELKLVATIFFFLRFEQECWWIPGCSCVFQVFQLFSCSSAKIALPILLVFSELLLHCLKSILAHSPVHWKDYQG